LPSGYNYAVRNEVKCDQGCKEALVIIMSGNQRTEHVGVRLTPAENEALREAAFKERTTKSSLLRSLFLSYLQKKEREDESQETR